MKLVEPNVDFEASYLDYIAEIGDGVRIPFPLAYPHEPFHVLVRMLADQSRGTGLRDGFIPNSTFWLIEDRDSVAASWLAAITCGFRRVAILRYKGGRVNRQADQR